MIYPLCRTLAAVSALVLDSSSQLRQCFQCDSIIKKYVVLYTIFCVSVFLACDTTDVMFKEATPVDPDPVTGKCPSASRTQSFIKGERLCCPYDYRASPDDKPGNTQIYSSLVKVNFEGDVVYLPPTSFLEVSGIQLVLSVQYGIFTKLKRTLWMVHI